MANTSLIPWRKSNNQLAMRQREFDPFLRLRQDIDQMFSGMLGDWTGGMNLFDRTQTFMPIVDVHETEKEIRVTAELPGLDGKDLEVSLLEGALYIKGEKREEHEEEKGDVYRCERQYGEFQRMIQLPAEVDADKINASFKNGVLKVTLPKSEDARSNRRVIPVETT